MLVIDGNNTACHLKGIGDHQVGDSYVFSKSPFYILQEFVDWFKNEVMRKTVPEVPLIKQDTSSVDKDDAIEPEKKNSDPTDGAKTPDASCTKNWKAAASNKKKRMCGIFDETGIFACACHHGFIL